MLGKGVLLPPELGPRAEARNRRKDSVKIRSNPSRHKSDQVRKFSLPATLTATSGQTSIYVTPWLSHS